MEDGVGYRRLVGESRSQQGTWGLGKGQVEVVRDAGRRGQDMVERRGTMDSRASFLMLKKAMML
jgi:hypothetical protein